MNMIACNNGALRWTQSVNGSHIAQEPVADIMDVIVDDTVSFCRTGIIAPTPSNGNPGIGHETDVIVGDQIITAVTDPDPIGTGKVFASVLAVPFTHLKLPTSSRVVISMCLHLWNRRST